MAAAGLVPGGYGMLICAELLYERSSVPLLLETVAALLPAGGAAVSLPRILTLQHHKERHQSLTE